MSRAVQITFDCHDPIGQATFWAEVLGYVVPGPPGVKLEAGGDPFAAWKEFIAGMGIDMKPEDFRAAIEDPNGRGPGCSSRSCPRANRQEQGPSRCPCGSRAAEPRTDAGIGRRMSAPAGVGCSTTRAG